MAVKEKAIEGIKFIINFIDVIIFIIYKRYFIQPTVFSNVKDDMIIAKEEIFGPSM